MQSSKKHIFIIRHAESQYNAAMKNAIRLDRKSFEHEEDRVVKFCPELIDCGISEKGYGQCQGLRQELKSKNIKYVVVSPLKRALITCEELFYQHPAKPHVFVEPLMTELLLSNCDVGGNILESRTRFNFDFSFLDKLTYKKLWVLESLPRKNEILQMIRKEAKSEQDMQQRGPQILVRLMDSHFPETFETLHDAMTRSLKLKKLITEKYLPMLQPGQELALISHYRMAECLTATDFDQQTYKPVNGQSLKNCRLNEFYM